MTTRIFGERCPSSPRHTSLPCPLPLFILRCVHQCLLSMCSTQHVFMPVFPLLSGCTWLDDSHLTTKCDCEDCQSCGYSRNLWLSVWSWHSSLTSSLTSLEGRGPSGVWEVHAERNGRRALANHQWRSKAKSHRELSAANNLRRSGFLHPGPLRSAHSPWAKILMVPGQKPWSWGFLDHIYGIMPWLSYLDQWYF